MTVIKGLVIGLGLAFLIWVIWYGPGITKYGW